MRTQSAFPKTIHFEEGSMDRKLCAGLVPVLALFCISLAAVRADGQTAPAGFSFHAGQSMYIVAFRRYHTQVVVDPGRGAVATSENINLELGAARKVRIRIEEWQF